jgi:hypothetical protein
MAAIQGNVPARWHWTRHSRTAALLAAMLAALVAGAVLTTLDLSARTAPAREEVGRVTEASLAQPCRHEMTPSNQRPECAAASTIAVKAGDIARKPHGFGARGEQARECLRLPRRGWLCFGR